MVKAEIIKENDGIAVSVNGVADDTMNEVAAIVETIVGSCIERHGATFGREAFFDIMARAVAYIEQKSGVNILNEELDMKTRIQKNPMELLAEIFGNGTTADDETEDDLPDFMF